MIEWIKRMFGKGDHKTDFAFSEEDLEAARSKPEPPKSKLVKENGKEVGPIYRLDELEKMKKPELLKYAKSRGIRANASLKKQEIIERIFTS